MDIERLMPSMDASARKRRTLHLSLYEIARRALNAQRPFVGAKTGKEAWEHLRVLARQARAEGMPVRRKVALLLTDLEMPEMDGVTLTRQMKNDDALKSVPIVIHSSLRRVARPAPRRRWPRGEVHPQRADSRHREGPLRPIATAEAET